MAHPQILKLDIGGRPIEWLPWEAVVTLYFTDKVAWEAGSNRIDIQGGFGPGGERSSFSVSTIVAVPEKNLQVERGLIPPLTRRELYQRDNGMCMYCGEPLRYRMMQFEHIIPKSRGGRNTWDNVVAACQACNSRKRDRTPAEAGMSLIALPYTPNRAEWLILANRRILLDQQSFLESMAPTRAAA